VLAIIGQIMLAETAFALGVQLLVCLIGVTYAAGLRDFPLVVQSFDIVSQCARQTALRWRGLVGAPLISFLLAGWGGRANAGWRHD
jgi:hypothetical protein